MVSCNKRPLNRSMQEPSMLYRPDVLGSRDASAGRFGRIKRNLAGVALVAMLAGLAPAPVLAADCRAQREPRIPPSEEPILNIDKHKKQLLAYQAGTYGDDIALVIGDARTHVERRTAEVKSPAVVLDIDETSLSNWANIQ